MDHAVDSQIRHLSIRLVRRHNEVDIVCLQRLQDTGVSLATGVSLS